MLTELILKWNQVGPNFVNKIEEINSIEM